MRTYASIAMKPFFLLIVLLLAACAGQPSLVGVADPSAPAEQVVGLSKHRVFLATTRRLSTNPAEGFSGRRNNSLSYAAFDISVPPVHETGKIELPRQGAPDPNKHFTISAPTTIAGDQALIAQINEELHKQPAGQRSVLVFVHGYNTNLTTALLGITQFVEDTGYEGVPVLFSWPSNAELLEYVYDLNSVLHARDDAFHVMDTVLERTSADHYDLVAHSMGNMLAMEVGRQIALTGEINDTGKNRYIILAAPDIDIDVFAKQISAIPREKRRFYVLVSEDDSALKTSRLVAGGVPRVGAANAQYLAQLGVAVIDLSDVEDETSLNHSKFKDAPEVVQFIGENLAAGNTISAGQGGFGRAFTVGVGGVVKEVFN